MLIVSLTKRGWYTGNLSHLEWWSMQTSTVMRTLHENVRRKRPQKWQNQNLIIHHDNALGHRSFKVSEFLVKNNITVIPHPPYSPDLAPCDFFPFPKLKLRMKGRRFDTIKDSRGIAVGIWNNSKKGLQGMLPSMAETLGPLYLCKRGVLWRWWRNLTSKVSKLLFISTVLEVLDTPLYFHSLEYRYPWYF